MLAKKSEQVKVNFLLLSSFFYPKSHLVGDTLVFLLVIVCVSQRSGGKNIPQFKINLLVNLLQGIVRHTLQVYESRP